MVFGFVKKLFKKKDPSLLKTDSLDSIVDSLGLESDSLDSSLPRVGLDETRLKPKQSPQSNRLESDSSLDEQKKLEFEKDSIQLGMAAGYTSHFIKNIENSLNRIESLMVTKDWLEHKDKSVQMLSLLNYLKSIMEMHDKKTDDSLDNIQSSLERLGALSRKAPEPIRTELETEIQDMESKLPLSSQMQAIMTAIEKRGEVSYKDLTQIIGYKSVDSLRSYIAKMKKRGANIETFDKNNEKWVRVESNKANLASPTRVDESKIVENNASDVLESLNESLDTGTKDNE